MKYHLMCEISATHGIYMSLIFTMSYTVSFHFSVTQKNFCFINYMLSYNISYVSQRTAINSLHFSRSAASLFFCWTSVLDTVYEGIKSLMPGCISLASLNLPQGCPLPGMAVLALKKTFIPIKTGRQRQKIYLQSLSPFSLWFLSFFFSIQQSEHSRR